MKKYATIFLFLTICTLCAQAEILLLRTGARVEGTIVFQNEDVIILRNGEGARSQYPRSDVAEILSDDTIFPEEQVVETPQEPEITTRKKVSILLELGIGAAMIPNDHKVGVGYGVDLLVGTHHIGNRHIFVGGGIGYHGMAIGSTYNFLPLQAAVRLPLMESRHAPVLGLGVGYGVALSKDYLGGLYTGIDFGYRCQLNPKTALSLVLFAQFQQAKVKVTETITEGEDKLSFINKAGRSMVNTGLKFALYF